MTADTTLAEAMERCAREPIHVPSSIQPHGFLLVLDATTGQNALSQIEVFKEVAKVTEGKDVFRM